MNHPKQDRVLVSFLLYYPFTGRLPVRHGRPPLSRAKGGDREHRSQIKRTAHVKGPDPGRTGGQTAGSRLYGYPATVSRDIRQLHLSKVPAGNGRQKYVVLRQDDSHLWDKYVRVLRDGFVSMDMAQNILVIKTVSGMAMAVAAAVDAMKFREIVGSIAGDDTIMMAVRSVEDTRIVMDKIREILEK